MRKIWNTVLKGLVAILPLGLTVYVVYWLAVDGRAAVLAGHQAAACPNRTTGRGSAC